MLEVPSNSAYSSSSMNSPSDVIIPRLKSSFRRSAYSSWRFARSSLSLSACVSFSTSSFRRLSPGLSDFQIYLLLLILFIVVYNLHWFFSLFHFIDFLKFFGFTLTPHKVFLFILCLLTIWHMLSVLLYVMTRVSFSINVTIKFECTEIATSSKS